MTKRVGLWALAISVDACLLIQIFSWDNNDDVGLYSRIYAVNKTEKPILPLIVTIQRNGGMGYMWDLWHMTEEIES